MTDLFKREPDFTVTSADLVASGDLIDLTQMDVDVFYGQDEFDPAPVNRITHALYSRLYDVYFGPALAFDEDEHIALVTSQRLDASLAALLSFLLVDVEDTSEEGEPAGVLYATTRTYPQLHNQPVWLQRNDVGGWTAMLPSDY
jgi:hypothetical protein